MKIKKLKIIKIPDERFYRYLQDISLFGIFLLTKIKLRVLRIKTGKENTSKVSS